MRILVIGADGFIGQHCARFLGQNHQVVSQSRTTPLTQNIREKPFDVCINASGSANVGFSFAEPGVDFDLNVVNVHKLLLAMKEKNQNCRLLNFSSAAVYGNPQTLPIPENAQTEPVSPYGLHKLQSEMLLGEYARFFSLRTCSLRIFSAYGPGLRKQLFWDLYYKLRNSPDEVMLHGTGDETRDFIFIDDLMHAVDVILSRAPFHGESINVAAGRETTIREAAGAFLSHLAPQTQLSFSGATRTGDPIHWCADISLLRSFGFRPQFSISAGLKEYVKWLNDLE